MNKTRYFKDNNSYFKFLNKNKYQILKVLIKKNSIKVVYNAI